MRPVHTALAVLVAAVWGFNFVVIEIGLGHFPPLLLSALRFLVAALPAVFFVGRPKVAWKWILGVGAALGIAKFGLLFTGMAAGMPAGLSSLVLQIQAVFTAVLAAVVLRERPGPVRVLGMAVALAGIGVAAVDRGVSGPVTGFVLVVAAAACWGVSNVLTRRAAPPDALNFMVWVCTVPVIPLFALSLLLEGPDRDLAALRALDWSGWPSSATSPGCPPSSASAPGDTCCAATRPPPWRRSPCSCRSSGCPRPRWCSARGSRGRAGWRRCCWSAASG